MYLGTIPRYMCLSRLGTSSYVMERPKRPPAQPESRAAYVQLINRRHSIGTVRRIRERTTTRTWTHTSMYSRQSSTSALLHHLPVHRSAVQAFFLTEIAPGSSDHHPAEPLYLRLAWSFLLRAPRPLQSVWAPLACWTHRASPRCTFRRGLKSGIGKKTHAFKLVGFILYSHNLCEIGMNVAMKRVQKKSHNKYL